MKEMVETLEREKDAAEDHACHEQDKHHKVKEFGTKLRSSILHNMDVTGMWKPAATAATTRQLQETHSDHSLRNSTAHSILPECGMQTTFTLRPRPGGLFRCTVCWHASPRPAD
jgi:hypothetical protein